MKNNTNSTKKQLLIFLPIAYGIPILFGLLMSIGYKKDLDLAAFPTAQMFLPASGAMLAALITRKNDPLLPKPFFLSFLISSASIVICAVASVLAPALPWVFISQLLITISSVVCGIILLMEKKEKRIAYGLKGKNWIKSFLVILVFLALYFGRAILSYLLGGEAHMIKEIAQNPITWVYIPTLILNYFFVFTAFLGEEYGWRYYLQPLLQKRFGMVGGILLVGVMWGLWHLPINFFFYTSPSVGIISVVGQLITCITLGVFFGWAYLKTDNIWSVVILHYANNNLIPLVTGTFSADVIENQNISWADIPVALVMNGLLFMGFLFTKYYKDNKLRLPTMNERAEQYQLEKPQEPLIAVE